MNRQPLKVLALLILPFVHGGCVTSGDHKAACPKTPFVSELYGAKMTGSDYRAAYKRCSELMTRYCVRRIEKRPFNLSVECSSVM
jgi:hypothetical protein